MQATRVRRRSQFSCLSQNCCHVGGRGGEIGVNFRREVWLMGGGYPYGYAQQEGKSLQVTAERGGGENQTVEL